MPELFFSFASFPTLSILIFPSLASPLGHLPNQFDIILLTLAWLWKSTYSLQPL